MPRRKKARFHVLPEPLKLNLVTNLSVKLSLYPTASIVPLLLLNKNLVFVLLSLYRVNRQLITINPSFSSEQLPHIPKTYFYYNYPRIHEKIQLFRTKLSRPHNIKNEFMSTLNPV